MKATTTRCHLQRIQYYLQSYKRLYIFQFSTYIFSADITPEMLELCRVAKVKVFFLVLVYVFNFNLSEFSAAILEKGLLGILFIMSLIYRATWFSN